MELEDGKGNSKVASWFVSFHRLKRSASQVGQ